MNNEGLRTGWVKQIFSDVFRLLNGRTIPVAGDGWIYPDAILLAQLHEIYPSETFDGIRFRLKKETIVFDWRDE